MRDYRQIPGWLVGPFLLGSLLALAGAYWDDATHTEIGRDSFLIAPHVALYAGVMLAGAGLTIWAGLFIGRNGLSAVREQRPLVLAIGSVAITLGAGPIDNFWHLSFGRDAVLWSPPHMLGIVGMTGIAVAVLVELVRSDADWARRLRPLAGGLVLAGLAVAVMEFDTDVPQFAVVWYLPALALASALALALVKLVDGARFAATTAALVQLAFIGGVSLFLSVKGFDTPKLPLLVVPALVLDLLASRRGLIAVALAYSAALYLAYVPLLNLTGEGVRLGLDDVVYGFPVALAATLGAIAVIGAGSLRRAVPRRAVAVAAALLVVQLAGGVAWAHDPGQGVSAGSVDLSASVEGDRIRVTGQPHLHGPTTPVGVVARRGGIVKRGPLAWRNGTLVGDVAVDRDGRWFVYLDVRRSGRTVESWLPVKVGESSTRFNELGRFAYFASERSSSTVKWIAGVLLYAVLTGLLVAIARLARAAARGVPATGREA
jgi:hypothetical protein